VLLQQFSLYIAYKAEWPSLNILYLVKKYIKNQHLIQQHNTHEVICARIHNNHIDCNIYIYTFNKFIKDNFHVIPFDIIHSRKHACGQNVSIFLNNNTITCIFMGQYGNLSLTLMIPIAKLKVMNVVHNLYLT
jgi:hypothetical protein